MPKKKEEIIPFIFLLLLATFLSSEGVKQIIQKVNYVGTDGVFSHSSSYRTKDDDGHYVTEYKWYYNYTVDGQSYSMYTSGHDFSSPSNKNETILYNPSNHSMAIIQSDHQGAVMVIAGIWCGIIAYVVGPYNNSKGKYIQDYEKARKKGDRAVATVWFILCGLFYLVMLISVDFDFNMMFGPLLPASIVIFIFFCLGFVFLLDTKKSAKYYKGFLEKSSATYDNSIDGLNNDLVKSNKNDAQESVELVYSDDLADVDDMADNDNPIK